MQKICCALLMLSSQFGAASERVDSKLALSFHETIHRMERDGSVVRSHNVRNEFALRFSEIGMSAQLKTQEFSLRLHSFGYSNHHIVPDPARISSSGRRVDLHRGILTEWYINDDRGIEQGFTVFLRPGTTRGKLEFDLSVSGGLKPAVDGDGIALQREGRPVLRYAGLRSWDAQNRELPSRMEVQGSTIRLVVDDSAAIYPITVDPWLQAAMIVPNGLTGISYCGNAVALKDSVAAIGCPSAGTSGAVYIYGLNAGGTWEFKQMLTPNDGASGDRFGASMSMSGSTLVVGAPDKLSGRGAAYVYTQSGSTFSLQQKLTASDAANNDKFGSSVAVDGDSAIIGAFAQNSFRGAVYPYQRASNVWAAETKITAPDAAQFATFGYQNVLWGDYFMTTAPGRGNQTGGAYIYKRFNNAWSYQRTVTASDGVSGDRFGFSGDLCPNWAVVAAPYANGEKGRLYYYSRPDFTEIKKVTASDGVSGDQFGTSVQIDRVGCDALVVGAPGNSGGKGKAYIERYTNYVEDAKLTANPGASNDNFGQSSAIYGSNVFIGAPGRDLSKGGGFIFNSPPPPGHTLTILSDPTAITYNFDGIDQRPTPDNAPVSDGIHWLGFPMLYISLVGSDVYAFDHWQDDPSNKFNPRLIEVSADQTYKAIYTKYEKLFISSSPTWGGSVSATGASYVIEPGTSKRHYASGSQVTLSAQAAPGSVFTGWIGTGPGSYSGMNPTPTIMPTGLVTQTATFTAPPLPYLTFIPTGPCRLLDTRNPEGPFGGPIIRANTFRDYVIPSNACNIPSTAYAYALNATVVPSGSLGFLTLWPSGVDRPNTSTLNSFDGRIKANAAIVPAGTNGAISAFVTNDTHLILDINGYFQAGGGLKFFNLNPCRVVDTRNPNSVLGGPILGSNQSRSFPILSSACGVPATAKAYSLNYTVVPSGGLGYLTTWPTGTAQPFVSTLNSPNGQVVANAAIVPAGTNGSIDVFVTNPTHLVIDINGYFADPAPGGLQFAPMIPPCRALDTRNAVGMFGGPSLTGGQSRSFPLMTSGCPIPAATQAYSGNATVVPPAALGYLSLYPTGQPLPLVSTLNAFDGSVTSNGVILPAGNGGAITAFAANLTDFLFDINGVFVP